AGALRTRHRARARGLRGALQPRQHLPRPRTLPRGAGVLSRFVAAEPGVRRRALLPGGHAREERPVTGRARALEGVPAAVAARRGGRAGEGIFVLVAVIVRRISLLRRPPQLVVRALGAPGVRVEALRAGVGLDLAMRAELLVAVLGRLHPAAGTEADERRRFGAVGGHGPVARFDD